MKKLFSKIKATKGFTLVEMIVVMAIIGILVALLAPNVATLIRDAQNTSDDAKVKNVMTTLAAYNTKMVKDGFAYDVTQVAAAATASKPVVLADGTNGVIFHVNNDNINGAVQSVWVTSDGSGGVVSTDMAYAGESTGYLPANIMSGGESMHIILTSQGHPIGVIYVDALGVIKAANTSMTRGEFGVTGATATEAVNSSTVRDVNLNTFFTY